VRREGRLGVYVGGMAVKTPGKYAGAAARLLGRPLCSCRFDTSLVTCGPVVDDPAGYDGDGAVAEESGASTKLLSFAFLKEGLLTTLHE
jgi:hypothetical protein